MVQVNRLLLLIQTLDFHRDRVGNFTELLDLLQNPHLFYKQFTLSTLYTFEI